MNNRKPVIKWFQEKICEIYGKPQIITVSLPPKIEWEEIEVPYDHFEEYTETIREGTSKWVLYVSVAVGLIGITLILAKISIALGIIVILSDIAFYAFGKNQFLNTKEITHKRKVIKIRKEKKEKEIPQYKEETIVGEWSIKRMGTGQLEFYVSDVNGSRFLSGVNFSKSTQNFQYPYVEKEKEFTNEFFSLEKELEQTPYVLNGDKESFDATDDDGQQLNVLLSGLEKDIMNHFISTEFTFMNPKSKKVSSTLFNEKDLKSFLVKSYNKNITIDDFLQTLSDGLEFDNTCRHWLNNWPDWNKTLNHSRLNSITEQVIPEFAIFSNLTHYSSFNFYCPTCNKEIEEELMKRDYSVHSSVDLAPQRFSSNTRCRYLLELNAWECPMCEKVTLNPIPLHKTLDDILFPVYDSLMEENKNEREKDYSDVRKKEIHYKNEMKKELEKMYFDNLNGILELKDSMEKMHAEIDGESEAIQFINESITKYKKLQSEIIDSIESANEEIKMRIQVTAQKILADVDRVKNREMELLNQELTQLSKAKRLDDERRDSIQRDILSANKAQNQILHEGFNKVSNSVNQLNETTAKGLDKVAGGISELNETTKEGFKKQLESNARLENYASTANAMQAGISEKMGVNPYDDNSLLRPGRAFSRFVTDMGHKLTGTSSIEANKKKLNTISK
jgi:hypothetical protein